MISMSKLIVIALLLGGVIGCSKEASNQRLLESADRYFDSGEYDKAKIEYLNLLRADPQNAAAISRLGIIWFEQGAALQAIPFLLKTRDLSPENLEAREKLAKLLVGLGRPSEARKEATEILKLDPANQSAILVLADTARSEEEIAATESQLQELKDGAPLAVHLASASLSARKGDLAAAEREALAALKLDQNSIEAHLALASIFASKGERDKAIEELSTAASLSPVRSVARLKFAESQAQSGSWEEARNSLAEITREAPDYLPAWIRLAQIDLAEKKYNDALAKLENVFGRDSMNYDGRLLEAQILLAKGETDKALERLKRLDDAYPGFPLTKFQLARAYLQQGSLSQARAALQAALEVKPDFTEASLVLAELRLRNGDPQPVIASMKEVLDRKPDLVQAHVLLAEAYRDAGNFNDSVSVLREQIAASPELPQLHLLLGAILRQQQKPEEARKEFEKVRELTPDHLLALLQLTDLDIQKGDFDAALERARRQLEKTPESAGVHFALGRVYVAQKEWEKAEASLRKVLELDATFTPAYSLLVGIYMANNRMAEAARELEKLLATQPDNTRARLTLALIYERMKEFARAQEAYEKVLTVSPDSAVALNNLAWLYVTQLNDLDRAYDLATKARRVAPGDGGIADTLGWTLYQRGDYQKALPLLQESASKLPDVPEIQFHLGMASYMMGRMEVARAALRQATEATEEFPGKEEARRRLALLGESAEDSPQLSAAAIEKILEENPDDPVARMRLGHVYESRGAFSEAAEAYERALKVNPQLVTALNALAQLYSGPLDDKEKALELAKKARELAPTDPKVAGMLGRVAYQSGSFAWAYSLLEESRNQLPEDVGVLYGFAWAAYSLGKVEEAQEAMKQVTKSAPESPEAKDAKSFVAMTALLDASVSEVMAAQTEMEALLRSDPEYVPALMARARLQEGRDDREAAASTYGAVLERFPRFAPAQVRLAALFAEIPDKRAKAYELAVEARKALPDDPELARTLAEISYYRNEFAYAAQLLRESAAKEPLGATNLYYLGMSLRGLKDNAGSQDALQQALSAGLQEPLSTQARQVLSELREQ